MPSNNNKMPHHTAECNSAKTTCGFFIEGDKAGILAIKIMMPYIVNRNPTKNQMDKLCSSCIKNYFYQNIICKIIKTPNMMAAQKTGRFIKGSRPSDGNFVQLLTNPASCASGLGSVT